MLDKKCNSKLFRLIIGCIILIMSMISVWTGMLSLSSGVRFFAYQILFIIVPGEVHRDIRKEEITKELFPYPIFVNEEVIVYSVKK